VIYNYNDVDMSSYSSQFPPNTCRLLHFVFIRLIYDAIVSRTKLSMLYYVQKSNDREQYDAINNLVRSFILVHVYH